MLQASARGVIDFSKADIVSVDWWSRFWLMLEQVQTDNMITLQTLQHSQHIAAFNTADAKAFEHHWEHATSSYKSVFGLLFPAVDTEAEKTGIANKLRDAWVNKFGDPNDPLTATRIKETIAALKARKKVQTKSIWARPKKVSPTGLNVKR